MNDNTFFTSLYNEYRLLVFNRIHQSVLDIAICEDLTQETFIKAWHALPRLDRSRNVRGWLCVIASHIVVDYYRTRASHEMVLSYNDRPEQDVIDHKLHIENTLASMRQRDKDVIVLHHVHGYTTKEIAEKFHTSDYAIRVRLTRSNKKFKKLYTEAS